MWRPVPRNPLIGKAGATATAQAPLCDSGLPVRAFFALRSLPMSLTVTTSRVVRNKNAIEMNSPSQLVLILFIIGIMVFL